MNMNTFGPIRVKEGRRKKRNIWVCTESILGEGIFPDVPPEVAKT